MSHFFPRIDIATRIATTLLSHKVSSGLFLSAPRRTGKSTFLHEDLIPRLKQNEAVEIIFIDLWSDRNQDPAKLIADAIRKSFNNNKSLFEQIGGVIQKVKVAGYSIDLNDVGVGKEVTLSDALHILSSKLQKMIVMIIDEAQHAMTTTKGSDALFALKAARDLLNSSGNNGFRLVATGSNREKLSTLVNGKDQAFLNATLVDLPYLGDNYLQRERDQIVTEPKPSLHIMKEAFTLTSYKPEPIQSALTSISLDFSINANTVDAAFFALVQQRIEALQLETLQILKSLRPLEAAILFAMAKSEDNFSPFKSDFIEQYKTFCQSYCGESLEVNASSVQYALDQLREKGFVWRSARGVYAFEEASNKEIVLGCFG